jgi:ATPase family associated with various cellular activities (AAA)
MTADPHQAAEQAALLAALQPVAAAINGKPEETPCSSLPCAGLERVCTAFGLSRFERSVLLLCAGVELDSRFADACAAAHGDPGRGYATFGLALATLPGAHWSALTPARPLRAWRLLEMQGADTLATSRLRIGERILHSLVGVESNEPAFDGVIVRIAPEQAELQAAEFGGIGLDTLLRNGRRLTFTGRNARQRRAAACLALMQADLSPWVLRASDIPSQAAERAQLRLLWNREIRLVPSGLCLEISSADPPEVYRHTAAFLAGLEGAVVVTMTEEVFLDDDSAAARIELPALDASKRRDAWRDGLGEAASRLNGGLDAVIEQFAPGAESLALVSSTLAAMPDAPASALSRAAWTICREQARRPMAQLARRIAPRATWEDLVLPEGQSQMLRQIAAHLRHRRTVHETWGFADSSARGLGLTALFSGASGTGKTMAAEVLAGWLDLDLFHIDLSATVSKYIGETEKNLSRLFEAAEAGGAILLFDEADALFGKRTEVKDSHDRYANLEVSYLLQRMEAYRGLAILTTNVRSALDAAFLRRIRFVIDFPFPDATQRERIWCRSFPPATPTDGLDFAQLARLSVTGGVIRNIATHAAFRAADAGGPVRMADVMWGAQVEYAKLDKPLTPAEMGGWR